MSWIEELWNPILLSSDERHNYENLCFVFAISKYLISNESKDPKEVIIDEFIGQFIALIFIPNSVLGLLLSFLLFRFFDITKLYPVGKVEKIPGAIGVLADDVVAGLMTAGIIIFLNIFGIDL